MESNQIESCEFTAKPIDSRCRYWAKVVREGTPLPLPSQVSGANDIPGSYMRQGDSEEIFPGDWVLVGEQNHHRKQRGWSYWLKRVQKGKIVDCKFGSASEAKAYLREHGRKDLLLGAGDCAAMVREIHVRNLRANG